MDYINELTTQPEPIAEGPKIEELPGGVLNLTVTRHSQLTEFGLDWSSKNGEKSSTKVSVPTPQVEEFRHAIANGWFISEYARVHEFTQEASVQPLPTAPQLMNAEQVRFISRMVSSELLELIQTVTESPEEAIGFLHSCVESADINRAYKKPTTDVELIAEQLDAAVDIKYYIDNNACKFGTNTNDGFYLAHEANMSKRFPDGNFHLRNDGKIIKPPNWKEPDVVAYVRRKIAEDLERKAIAEARERKEREREEQARVCEGEKEPTEGEKEQREMSREDRIVEIEEKMASDVLKNGKNTRVLIVVPLCQLVHKKQKFRNRDVMNMVPMASNYLVEIPFSMTKTKGRVVSHHGNFVNSGISLDRHLELSCIQPGDKLGFSEEQWASIGALFDKKDKLFDKAERIEFQEA